MEGPEGCGKTCHIPFLVESLRERGLNVFPTREPGGTSISEQIRDVIQDLKNAEMHPRAETLLYQAARAQIVEQVLLPKLESGIIVISDRYFDSTLAYQGYGHNQDIGKIRSLVDFATNGLKPDLTIFMDVDVEVGLSRKTNEWNRMDAMPPEFHHRVHDGYLKLVAEEPERWITVNANLTIPEVRKELILRVEGRLISAGFLEGKRPGPER